MGDTRPAVWVGHVVLGVTDADAAARFWESLGMRTIERADDIAIFELRGGTHLILLANSEIAKDADAVPFDLMVEDLEATHREYSTLGIDPSAITTGRIHSSFTVTDPDGRALTVNSSHVVGEV